MASLYPFIKEDILKDIQSGVYQEDKMLPPEREFTEKYRVSRMTIRRALDELIQDGVLIRKSGSGVFIAKNKKSRSISKVSIQTDEEIVKTYGKVIIKVVSIKTVVNHPLALRYLDVKTDEEVFSQFKYASETSDYAKDAVANVLTKLNKSASTNLLPKMKAEKSACYVLFDKIYNDFYVSDVRNEAQSADEIEVVE